MKMRQCVLAAYTAGILVFGAACNSQVKPPSKAEHNNSSSEYKIEYGKYYKDAEGKTGDELKAALHDTIDDHTQLSYSQCWEALKEIDEDPQNSENVIEIYKGESISKEKNKNGKDDWNREHIWAKSHGNFGTRKGAGTDLHNLRPADVSVNSSRGNLDFDNGGKLHKEAVECKYDRDSWEPRNEVKGDIARTLFYMAVRYEGGDEAADLELLDKVNSEGGSKKPLHGKLSTLLKWHKDDPVDDYERRRNNIIYEKYQHNRNPFIDKPEWAALIWK